jgi:plasmid stability protein
MPSITIRNVPPEIHAALKARARKHGVSLSREIQKLLEESVSPTPRTAKQVIEDARRLRSMVRGRLTNRDVARIKNGG